MSQNNTINKSDKKYIRTQKAKIRSTVLDLKKQEELINNLYKKFLPKTEVKEVKETKEVKKEAEAPKKVEAKVEVKKEKPKAKKVASKK